MTICNPYRLSSANFWVCCWLISTGAILNSSSCTKQISQGVITSSQPVLRHVVSFQFKEEVTEERRHQAVLDFLVLKEKIPEILAIEGGENVSTGGLDKGFTHCFVLTFQNEAARDEYLPHPDHVAVVNKNKPLLKDLWVMDYWSHPKK